MAKTVKLESGEIQVTLKEVVVFRNAVNTYLARHPEERSKLTWGLIKLRDRLEKIQADESNKLNEAINELKVKFASLKDGNLIENRFDYSVGKEDRTETRYTYTPEKKVEMDKAILKLSLEADEILITVRPFIVPIPEDFDFIFFDVFKKFVFGDINEEQEFELYLNSKPKKKSIESVLN